MQLNDLINLIKKYLILIVIFALIGAFVSASSASFFSSGFEHQRLYFLTDPILNNQISQNPNSESFLLQEKSRNFTDTAIAILDSPDFKSLVLENNDSLEVRKIAPQIIRLTLISSSANPDHSKLQKLLYHYLKKV